jgi:hypothetical protein
VATGHVVCQRGFIPEINVVQNISKPVTALWTRSFYASNNKSSGVAKTIDNIIRIVKDRIQDQPINVKLVNIFLYVLQIRLSKSYHPIYDYVASMG